MYKLKILCRSLLFPLLLAVNLPVPVATAQEQLPDVRLLIDVSGSMRASDPENLRRPALELMVQLLPEGSRAGVWTFGKWINMVVPLGEVDDAWRAQAATAVADISNHGLLTNIPEAIEQSTFDIERLQHQYRTSLILLTDGKVDVGEEPGANQQAEQLLLQQVARELRDWGVSVHTIALSDDADWDFLRAFAQATGGLAERAQSPEELSAVFLQALDIAAPTEQVPLLGGEFLIDDSVEEFTALVFPDAEAGEVSLIDPEGNAISLGSPTQGVNWIHNERFELITVREPADGEWRIVAPGSIARVNVISHLRLVLDRLPTTMPSGHTPELGMRLQDSDQVIIDPELLGLVTARITVSRGDRQRWNLEVAGASAGSAGELRAELPMLAEPGRYEIVVELDGRSFQREVSLLTDVIAPTPDVDPLQAIPASQPGSGAPAWLAPAGVSLLLLLALGLWFWRRQQQANWAADDYARVDDLAESYDNDLGDDFSGLADPEFGEPDAFDTDDDAKPPRV